MQGSGPWLAQVHLLCTFLRERSLTMAPEMHGFGVTWMKHVLIFGELMQTALSTVSHMRVSVFYCPFRRSSLRRRASHLPRNTLMLVAASIDTISPSARRAGHGGRAGQIRSRRPLQGPTRPLLERSTLHLPFAPKKKDFRITYHDGHGFQRFSCLGHLSFLVRSSSCQPIPIEAFSQVPDPRFLVDEILDMPRSTLPPQHPDNGPNHHCRFSFPISHRCGPPLA
jgi:hypothetical protein